MWMPGFQREMMSLHSLKMSTGSISLVMCLPLYIHVSRHFVGEIGEKELQDQLNLGNATHSPALLD